jgi:hypothetical protein
MILVPAAAAAATLLAFALLCAGGYLMTVALLGEERCRRDPLTLAVGLLVGATAQALVIGLALGMAGALRIGLALPIQALLVGLLLRARRRAGAGASGVAGAGTAKTGGVGTTSAASIVSEAGAEGRDAAGTRAAGPGAAGPARTLAERMAARLREHPLLALLAVHAVGSEALRGLLRPPLSWDSLMYHLLLAATWLQDHAISVVYGAYPTSYYGYAPANGSLWLWWWMAPSHSELYVNLAFLPHWLLLGLATGGVARELGARRSWPLAAYLVLLCPTVVRFAATEYVDILLGAMLAAATFFGLVWLRQAREPRLGDAAFAGMAVGIAAGTKVIGPPFALALGAGLLLALRGAWSVRLRQGAVAVLLAASLGGYFYLRNMAAGAGPLAMACVPPSDAAGHHQWFPNPSSALGNLGSLLADGSLADAFLGMPVPTAIELGIGPQLILLLPALGLPLLLPRHRRRGALVVWVQILAQLVFWFAVPQVTGGVLFANVRYLIAAIGLGFAGLAAACEQRGVWDRAERAVVGLAAALLIQDLLMLHAEMPREVRVMVAAADAVAALVIFSPALAARLRRFAAALAGPGAGSTAQAGSAGASRRVAWAAAAALSLALLAGAPWLTRFRAKDRTRALATEYTAHDTMAHEFARAWGWLERHGDAGTVAVAINPGNYFVYPAMGMGLRRRAVYANVNRQDRRRAIDYPGCGPRVDADPAAWIENLDKLGVRWVHLGRFEKLRFPLEGQWAHERPDRFTLRYADRNNLIFELSPPAAGRPPGARARQAGPG